MSFWTDLGERLSDLRDRAAELWQDLIAGGEAELGEYDIFDEEEAEEELDVIEDEIAEIEEIIDVEPDEIDFPDWVSDEDIADIIEETGVTKYDDLFESERDELLPGWRGFEEADEAAIERENFRDEMQSALGIPDEIMDILEDEALFAIEQMSDSIIGMAREFEELSPEEVAEELEYQYRKAFEDWGSFVQSNLFGFLMDRPDLFDIYVNSEGGIEVYEKDTTP